MSTLLAFDTATEQLSIAVEAHGRVTVHEAVGGAKASSTLIPSILGLLRDAGVTLHDLDAIAFGRGPGAFTGLRTACAVAQGLAFGAGKRVLPIDTLLAVAEDARVGCDRSDRFDVWAVMDARMDEVYAAHARHEHGDWRWLHEPALLAPARLNELWRIDPPSIVAGNALDAFGARLVTGDARRLGAARPSAAAMLPLARALLARGGAVDAASALPLYLRDKVALTTGERAAERARRAAGEPNVVAAQR